MKRLIVYFHYDPLGQIDTACLLYTSDAADDS